MYNNKFSVEKSCMILFEVVDPLCVLCHHGGGGVWADLAAVGPQGDRVLVHEAGWQHLGHQRPVAGLADEEDEHDQPDAPVDDLQQNQDRMLRSAGVHPIHEERSTLQNFIAINKTKNLYWEENKVWRWR